jgi:hypothetical protein
MMLSSTASRAVRARVLTSTSPSLYYNILNFNSRRLFNFRAKLNFHPHRQNHLQPKYQTADFSSTPRKMVKDNDTVIEYAQRLSRTRLKAHTSQGIQ